MDDLDGPERAPRRRYASHKDDVDADPGPTPPRRRRTPRESSTRTPLPKYRPRDWEPPEPPERPRRSSRYESAYEPYEPYGSYESPEPYDAPPAPSTHHPFSNVRYRGSTDDDEDDSRYRRPPRS